MGFASENDKVTFDRQADTCDCAQCRYENAHGGMPARACICHQHRAFCDCTPPGAHLVLVSGRAS